MRRHALVLATAGLLLGTGGAAGLLSAVAAAPAPGSQFASLDVTAVANGMRAPFYNTGAGGQDVEGEVPHALATLSSGGFGHALASVFWPGDTGGHGGDTLYLLGPVCIPPNPQGLLPLPCPTSVAPPPEVYSSLNNPYKAETQTGTGPKSTTLSNPGVDMSATSTATKVVADATVSGSNQPGLSNAAGKTTANTTIQVTGPHTVTVSALGTAQDISLGAGAITIDSVRSTAQATTDGIKAVGTATTTVTGMKVGGVPVTVDQDGIHVNGTGSDAASTAQLNALLKQTGFAVYVTAPSRTVAGGSITLDAGSLIVEQTNDQYTSQANATGRMLVFGGSRIIAGAGVADAFEAPTLSEPQTAAPAAVPGAPTGGGSAGTPIPPIDSPPLVAPPPDLTGGSVAAPLPEVAPQTQALGYTLPGGIPLVWTLSLLAGAGLFMAGLRRLPDEVLTDRGPACPIEETA